MKSTREKIIHTLLERPNATINELAEVVNINGISVRHHLTNLEADGFVVAEEERHGVGRPRLVYRLTERAIEIFPTSYLKLTKHILDQLKVMLSEEQIDEFFKSMALQVTKIYTPKIYPLLFDEKLVLVKEFLAKEGFITDWVMEDGKFTLNNYNCPYFHIVTTHPEICKFDKFIISSLLSMPVTLKKHRLNGDTHCTFTIENEPLGAKNV